MKKIAFSESTSRIYSILPFASYKTGFFCAYPAGITVCQNNILERTRMIIILPHHNVIKGTAGKLGFQPYIVFKPDTVACSGRHYIRPPDGTGNHAAAVITFITPVHSQICRFSAGKFCHRPHTFRRLFCLGYGFLSSVSSIR